LQLHQNLEPVVDGVSGEFDALSQLSPVRLKQRNIEEVAPVSSVIGRHDGLLSMNGAILANLGPIVKLIVRFYGNRPLGRLGMVSWRSGL
jgi:hypothetical protein